jgi:hypothetical protein
MNHDLKTIRMSGNIQLPAVGLGTYLISDEDSPGMVFEGTSYLSPPSSGPEMKPGAIRRKPTGQPLKR